jgi:hypothetical protein
MRRRDFLQVSASAAAGISLPCLIPSLVLGESGGTMELKADLSKTEWKQLHDSFAELRSQVVVIKHREFPGGLWYLRFPEQIATDKDAKTGPYQVGMNWKKSPAGWQFSGCPIVGLKGAIRGSISVHVSYAVDFSLTIENQSKEHWPRTLAWLCFNHSCAKAYYRYRNFVCSDSVIVTTPSKIMEHYCIGGHNRNWWTRGKINPTESLIGTSCITENGQEFCVAIGVQQAIMVGQNPGWPCTDIAPLFGDVPPGASATVRGRIYFQTGDPGKTRELYRRDFALR